MGRPYSVGMPHTKNNSAYSNITSAAAAAATTAAAAAHEQPQTCPAAAAATQMATLAQISTGHNLNLNFAFCATLTNTFSVYIYFALRFWAFYNI